MSQTINSIPNDFTVTHARACNGHNSHAIWTKKADIWISEPDPRTSDVQLVIVTITIWGEGERVHFNSVLKVTVRLCLTGRLFLWIGRLFKPVPLISLHVKGDGGGSGIATPQHRDVSIYNYRKRLLKRPGFLRTYHNGRSGNLNGAGYNFTGRQSNLNNPCQINVFHISIK
ncbi:hypothetical protein BMS3Bbin04_00267 [bacterium BMS3Bbin04]|nr:hypothetical protein BMS3Bbin04_00267 [bacterium BMS3Bbin04]